MTTDFALILMLLKIIFLLWSSHAYDERCASSAFTMKALVELCVVFCSLNPCEFTISPATKATLEVEVLSTILLHCEKNLA